MKLIDDWKTVLRKAWSVRLMVAAGALSGLEVVLPFFTDAMPRRVFATLSFVVVALACVARIVAQKDSDGVSK